MEKPQSSQQTQIVRQSSLKLMLEWSSTCDKCLTLKELVTMTEVVTEYVQTGYNKEIGERLDKIENYLNTK
jgi:hypothetical protein